MARFGVCLGKSDAGGASVGVICLKGHLSNDLVSPPGPDILKGLFLSFSACELRLDR